MGIQVKYKIFGAVCDCPALERDNNCCTQFLLNDSKLQAWEDVCSLTEKEQIQLDQKCYDCFRSKFLQNTIKTGRRNKTEEIFVSL